MQPKSKIASKAAVLLGISKDAVSDKHGAVPSPLNQGLPSMCGSPLLLHCSGGVEGPFELVDRFLEAEHDQAAGDFV